MFCLAHQLCHPTTDLIWKVAFSTHATLLGLLPTFCMGLARISLISILASPLQIQSASHPKILLVFSKLSGAKWRDPWFPDSTGWGSESPSTTLARFLYKDIYIYTDRYILICPLANGIWCRALGWSKNHRTNHIIVSKSIFSCEKSWKPCRAMRAHTPSARSSHCDLSA